MKTTKISLDADDFQCLVRGGILTIKHKDSQETHIVLKDIGFDIMHSLIDRVENGDEKIYVNREKEG